MLEVHMITHLHKNPPTPPPLSFALLIPTSRSSSFFSILARLPSNVLLLLLIYTLNLAGTNALQARSIERYCWEKSTGADNESNALRVNPSRTHSHTHTQHTKYIFRVKLKHTHTPAGLNHFTRTHAHAHTHTQCPPKHSPKKRNTRSIMCGESVS